MPSVYVAFEKGLSADAVEGALIPLLRYVDGDPKVFTWGFALRRRDEASVKIEDRRRNLLAASVLFALGFKLDENNGKALELFDFFHLPATESLLIAPIEVALFKDPPKPEPQNQQALVVLSPTGKLALLNANTPSIKLSDKARFAVPGFEFFDPGLANANSLVLGSGNTNDTDPQFSFHVRLSAGSAGAFFPQELLPKLAFSHDRNANADALILNLKINGKSAIPNNTESMPNDTRFDRLTAGAVTLLSTALLEAKPLEGHSLALEVFPTIAMQPADNIPLSITLSNQAVRLRLFAGDRLPQLKFNPLEHCVAVSIEGPAVHAEPASSNSSECLAMLEPADRKINEAVDTFNRFMNYSFKVCTSFKAQTATLEALIRFDLLKFELPRREWWISKKDLFQAILALLDRPLTLECADFSVDSTVLKLKIPNIEQIAASFPVAIKDSWSLFAGIEPQLERLDFEELKIEGGLLLVRFARPPKIDAQRLQLWIRPADFSFQMLNVGLPSLLPLGEVSAVTLVGVGNADWKITFKFPLDVPLELLKRGRLKLKRPEGTLDLGDLKQVASAGVGTYHVTVKAQGKLPAVGVDLVEIDWDFGFESLAVEPNVTFPTVTLHEAPLRLPKIEGTAKVDYQKLKLRLRCDGVDIGSVPILKIDGTKVSLDLELRGKRFDNLKKLLGQVTLDVTMDLSLPLNSCSLTDLLGNLPVVGFRLSLPESPQLLRILDLPELPALADLQAIRSWKLPDIGNVFGSLTTPILSFELIVRIPRPGDAFDELRVVLGLQWNLPKMRLLSNRIYFFLPRVRSASQPRAPQQVVDLDIFTLTFPTRGDLSGYPSRDNHDGYLDLNLREFVVDLIYQTPVSPRPKIRAYFPGGMLPEAASLGLEGVETSDASEPQKKKLQREFTSRFQLELDPIDPALWPEPGPNPLLFRLNNTGLSLAANLSKTEVLVDDHRESGLLKSFKFDPQESRGELRSRVVVIGNQLREAAVYAKTEVPGVDDLVAQVAVALRQTAKGRLPDVIASMELERANEAPLAEFSIKLLQMSLDRLALGLVWRRKEREWDYSAVADGTVSFTGGASLVDDLDGLRAPSIKLMNLDLRRMNLREMRIPLDLVEPVRFEILDGMFGVELGDLELGWEFANKIPKPRLLKCELAKLEFKNPGALEVGISVGGLDIEFDDKLRAHIKTPSSLGLEVALGPSVRFAGRVGWVEEKEFPFQRYLFAEGKVLMEGMPEISGLLKFGTGVKNSGKPEINLVIFGEMDLDQQLFAGVVVKRMGLGLALNNQLAAVPPRPSADAIIEKIDQIKPGKLESWRFVPEGGLYVSVIGSVTLASTTGEPTILNAYVAQLVVSFDNNFDLVAAGKLWLSTSLNGQRDNPNNPAFVGAMVMSPREQKLELVLQSRENPYIEQNDLMRKLLSKSRVRFEFRMTPDLVDFHLAELSYRDTMFGVDMQFLGSYRFAIFKRAVLLKAELSATGRIERSLKAGPGGFELSGDASLAIAYGGLLTDSGAMAYAGIDASITFRVSAWIEIGFSKSFKICGKRISISWTVTFRASVPRLELTFRGHVALSDRRGIGVDLQVGINLSICGYPLRASGRLAFNPELYEEVRNQVAAFESDLNDAVRKLGDRGAAGEVGVAGEPGPPGIAAQDILPTPALQPAAADPLALALAELPGEPEAAEEWLLYQSESSGSDAPVSLLLPKDGTAWLTPRISTIHGIKPGPEKGTAVLIAHGNTLNAGDEIEILGARGPGTESFNGKKTVTKRDAWSITISLRADFPENPKIFGGMWYPRVASPLLSQVDQDGVFYQQEVERVAVVPGAWKTIREVHPVGSGVRITLEESLGNELVGSRLLFQRPEGELVDYGAMRSSATPDVTLRIVEVTGNQMTVEAPAWIPQPDLPQRGWRTCRALEIAPTWSHRNRLHRVQTTENVQEFLEFKSGAANWVSTAVNADQPDIQPLDLRSYQVVFDRRYESPDRRFTVEPPGVVPSGTLSSRLKDPRSVDLVGVDQVLDSALAYAQAREELTRQELHEALDLVGDDEVRQARAKAVQLLLHRLKNAASDPSPDAPLIDFKSLKEQPGYGWLWRAPPTVTEVYVRRAGGVAKKVKLVPPVADTNKLPLETLPVRQDFLIDQAATVGERGRVVVKLPVKLDAEVLRIQPEKVAQFQIIRTIGNDASIIADFIRPDVSHLRKPQVYSIAAKSFVPDSELLSVPGKQGFDSLEQRWEFQFSVSQLRGIHPGCLQGSYCRNSTTGVEARVEAWRTNGARYVLTLASNIGEDNSELACNFRLPVQGERFVGASKPEFHLAGKFVEELGEIWLTAAASGLAASHVASLKDCLCRDEFTRRQAHVDQAAVTNGVLKLKLSRPLGKANEKMTFTLRSSGLIIPGVYLFSDEFLVEDRRFTDANLIGQGLGRAEVTYRIRAIGEGGKVQQAVQEWKPIQVFIPPRPESPRHLALAVSVADLAAGKAVPFQLISTAEQAPSLALRGDRAIRADEIELWASTVQLRQSGFYAADTTRLVTSSNVADNSKLQLDQMAADPLAETIDGKALLPLISSKDGSKSLQFPEMTFKAGTSYRLYLRFRDANDGLLVSLPVYLVRDLPPQWNANVRFRRVESLELVPMAHRAAFENFQVAPIPSGAVTADDLYSEGRAMVRMNWTSESVLHGGVELQFRDFDDSSVTGRMLCEVLEADEFQTMKGSFQEATEWRLPYRYSRERFASRTVQTPIEPPTSAFDACYIVEDATGAIQLLKNAAKALNEALPSDAAPKATLGWHAIARAIEGMHAAMLNFEKSPLHFEVPLVKAYFELTRKVLRALIVGQKLVDRVDFKAVDRPAMLKEANDYLAIAVANEKALYDLLDTAESPKSGVGESEEDTNAFLDRETIKTLAGIVRRRLAIANDAATIQYSRTAPTVAPSQQDPVVRETAFRATLEDADSLPANLSNTDRFRKLMPETSIGTNASLWRTLWQGEGERQPRAVRAIEEDPDRVGRIARAGGLTTFFKRLERLLRVDETDSFAAVIKRPHHELTTTKSPDGIKPRAVPLRAFLPADVRRVKAGEVPPRPDHTTVRQAGRVGRLAVLSEGGIVTIWSSLGENLAKHPLRRLHEFKVDDAVKSVDIEEGPDGPVLLARGDKGLDLWDVVTARLIKRHQGLYAGASFARTPRGLEIASISADSTAVEIGPLSAEANYKFTDAPKDPPAAGAPLIAFCYDDDSSTMAAIVGEAKLRMIVWHDLGRPKNNSPFASRELHESDQPAGLKVHLESVTLPGGLRYVLVETDAAQKSRVRLFDPEKQVFEELFANETPPFESIAVDRRALTLVIRFADQVTIYNLVERHVQSTTPVSAGIPSAILHSQNNSYVVVGKDKSLVLLHHEADPANSNPLQEVRLGAKPISLAAGLQTARVSNASRDVVSLFHLWQRMGFCLDFAAQDARGELLSSQKLESLAESVLEQMRQDCDFLPTHSAYLLRAEEHDAEFQPHHRVGLAFASVAIVPHDFIAAALQLDIVFLRGTLNKELGKVLIEESAFPEVEPNADPEAEPEPKIVVLSGKKVGETKTNTTELYKLIAPTGESEVEVAVYSSQRARPLIAWLQKRSIEIPNKSLPGAGVFAGSAAEQIIELAHVVHLMRLVGRPTVDRLGDLDPKGEKPDLREAAATELGYLAAQPVAERFLTVPASAGRSHASWSLPDHKGHRILASARYVSRYEPLLRWWKQDNARRDLPKDRFLAKVDSRSDKDGPMLHTIASVSGNVVILAKEVLPPSGRFPLWIEITSGSAKGIRREVTYKGPNELQFDPSDPLDLDMSETLKCRLIDRVADWLLISIDPVHDPALGQGPRPLMVYQYPHTRMARFSFQLPLDGMRAIYNQISRIRTGFNGIEAVFRYFLPDRSDNPDHAGLLDVLSVVQAINSGTQHPLQSTTLPRGQELQVRLFRHERMVTLPQLPYFYRYRLDVRSAYAARQLEHDRRTPADMLPYDENASPPGERLPIVLGVGRARVEGGIELARGTVGEDAPNAGEVVVQGAIDPSPFGAFLELAAPGTKPLPRKRVAQPFEPAVDDMRRIFLVGKMEQSAKKGWQYKLTSTIFRVTLPISAHRDHSTRDELSTAPSPIPINQKLIDSTTAVSLQAHDLPDLMTDYLLFYRLPETPSENGGLLPLPKSSRTELFLSVGSIRMPWSPQFNPPAGYQRNMPLVSLNGGLMAAADEAILEVATGQLAENPLAKSYAALDVERVVQLELTPLAGELKYGLGTANQVLKQGVKGTLAVPAGQAKTLKLARANPADRTVVRVRALDQAANTIQVTGQELSVPLEHFRIQDRDHWRLRFGIGCPSGNTTIEDPSQFFVQAVRLGNLSRAIAMERVTDASPE